MMKTFQSKNNERQDKNVSRVAVLRALQLDHHHTLCLAIG